MHGVGHEERMRVNEDLQGEDIIGESMDDFLQSHRLVDHTNTSSCFVRFTYRYRI